MKLGKINRQSIAISNFTSVLKEYDAMPSELFIAGTVPPKKVPCVAIIGSRRPTQYGKDVTYQLAYDLAKQGVVIVSGLAYGIDAVAHQAALDAGGLTIAVMANGLHRIYPSQHGALAERIVASGGAVISEQDLGVEARKYHFLARNRIVSGLADAIVITEATARSGTLSTVGHALDQNKEVFAVPGPITSLLSAGPNRLLQQGAHVALSARDILEVIAPTVAPQQTRIILGDTPVEVHIIEHMQRGIRTTDELLQVAHHPASEILQALTLMELKGIIRTTAGAIHLCS